MGACKNLDNLNKLGLGSILSNSVLRTWLD